MEDRAGEAAAFGGRGSEGVGDELGAHVVGERPADQASAVAVDDGGQVQVGPVGEREVGDVADVAPVRRGRGEVTVEQIGDLRLGLVGDRGADAALLDVAGDASGPHDTGDALVVHPLLGGGAVVELGGDPGRADGVVGLMNLADPRLELGVRRGPPLAGRCACLPGVVGRALDLDELAQSVHREGGGVVGDELEATHQRVSPAKYLAARWRISRSVVSLVVSARSAAFSASSRAIFCSAVSSARTT